MSKRPKFEISSVAGVSYQSMATTTLAGKTKQKDVTKFLCSMLTAAELAGEKYLNSEKTGTAANGIMSKAAKQAVVIVSIILPSAAGDS